MISFDMLVESAKRNPDGLERLLRSIGQWSPQRENETQGEYIYRLAKTYARWMKRNPEKKKKRPA